MSAIFERTSATRSVRLADASMSTLVAPFSAFFRHWSLTRELARRDILGRYRGANFGLLWSLLSPLLILVIYSVAFGEIMKSRWQTTSGASSDFAPVLFIGIVVHGFFAECVSRSPRLMQDNVSYVKRVVFPLDVLSWATVLSALFHLAMNLVVFLLLAGFAFHDLTPTALWLPVVLLPLVVLSVAVSWTIASLGVYVRDLQQIVPVLITAMFFLSSAVIPMDAVPERFRPVFLLNPLTFFINQARDVALWGHPPNGVALAGWAVGSVAAAYVAHAWLRLTSKGFADVL